MDLKKISVLGFILLGSLTACYSQTKTAVTSKEAKLVSKIKLSDQDIALFKDKTKEKVKEFEQDIVIIGSKEESAAKRDLAQKEALKLFYKGAQMEISKILSDGSTKIIARPMDKYLTRLKSLPYTKVVIKFYDIAYVSDFTRGPDGKYYSTATIIQEFTGFSGDNIVYKDVTKKQVEIIVDLVEDKFFNEKRWKLFLGDIKASETRHG